MKDTYSCGHVIERGSGIMIDTVCDEPCPECEIQDITSRQTLKDAVDKMLDTPLKALYLEVVDTMNLLYAEGYYDRAERLKDLLSELVNRSIMIGKSRTVIIRKKSAE